MVDPFPRPLCVDLDGTLLRTDLLVESAFALLKRNFLYLFLLPVWLLKGKAHLKQQIADRVAIDARLLPYHGAFLAHLERERAAGRGLILATASNRRFATAVASHLGIFDLVLASDATSNLSGERKLERIQDVCGAGGFDYAGNALADLPLWRRAGQAVLVNPAPGVREAVERQGLVAAVFDDREEPPLKAYLEAMRLHQWLKNLLVFVPLIMAHRFTDPLLLGQAIVAFLALSLCASSVYLLNDLLDLPDDRRHPVKRQRPLAAGSISVLRGAMLIPLLLAAAFGLALLLPAGFLLVLALYYATTLAYSLRLKRAALLDVLTLAGLYTLRIIAGAAAVSVAASFWLLAFSMFLFLSLALLKRFTELLTLKQHGASAAGGRAYTTVDLETLAQFGGASSYMSVLVLALYINSSEVRALYAHPEVIWLLCPLLLYLLTRVWLLARRGRMHEDPVIFVILDRRSQWLAAFGAALLWLAA